MKLGLVWEVKAKLEGKAALYIQNHLPRLHNGKVERKMGIQLTLKIRQENKNGADMLIYEPRADVLMHHLCTSRSLICMHIL